MQLHLDLGKSPAVALWELLGETERRAAAALVAELIAKAVAGEEAGDGE